MPAYRELFSDDELLLPRDEHEFADIIYEMLKNKQMREKYGAAGYNAVISRHTYEHRVSKVLQELELQGVLTGLAEEKRN